MGYGLGGAGAAAFNTKSDKRAISFVGDGGFWHNGLTSSIGNAVFPQHHPQSRGNRRTEEIATSTINPNTMLVTAAA